MTWGKIDPERLPDSVVCYTDTTIALPIMASYALAVAPQRPLKRLYDQRDALLDELRIDYLANTNGLPESAEDLPQGAGGTAMGRSTPGDE